MLESFLDEAIDNEKNIDGSESENSIDDDEEEEEEEEEEEANPASYAGPDKLYRFVRTDGKFVLSKYKIRKWLQRQEPYSLQRQLKRSFKRNRVVVIWNRRPMGCRFDGYV
ncbi:Hypothetical predicted protein [Mytilus galloprovincialis]|uniref:Uncharacterized protein n=1 Tax=Mytilus galloprovincialis TaxID=29158 RepID=A0A8B6C907_MYTGA|nr:Hypothetical predicted protein [Mytilus galloprovincialis]